MAVRPRKLERVQLKGVRHEDLQEPDKRDVSANVLQQIVVPVVMTKHHHCLFDILKDEEISKKSKNP
jgi:hypothetical protein